MAEISEEFETGDLAESSNQADARLQGAVAGAEYAEVLRGSECAGSEPLAGVLEEAERVAELLPGDDDVAEFADLQRQAAQIVARE